jgi:tRNA (mo5U34)-methyltransferase
LSFLGVDLLVRVPHTITHRFRSAFDPARVSAADRKVMERPRNEVRTPAHGTTPAAAHILERLREVSWWYHTIDLGHGVSTPGGFDHRPYLEHYPVPARLDGLRALDVGTFDGFWAFEFARRGATEVVALDVSNSGMLDLPLPVRRQMTEEELARPFGRGFEICRQILGLDVQRKVLSVYELAPEHVGTFDFVFISDVLLHLMNPMKALQNICKVTRGTAVIVETFDANLPGNLMEFQGGTNDCVWWRMSFGGLEKMVRDAGFGSVELVSKFPTGHAGEAPWLWHAAFRCTSIAT